jgi:cyanate lyase
MHNAKVLQLRHFNLIIIKEIYMEIPEVTKTLLAAKKAKGMTFADLEKVLGHDEVWIAALFYRQATASQEEANKLAAALDLSTEA